MLKGRSGHAAGIFTSRHGASQTTVSALVPPGQPSLAPCIEGSAILALKEPAIKGLNDDDFLHSRWRQAQALLFIGRRDPRFFCTPRHVGTRCTAVQIAALHG